MGDLYKDKVCFIESLQYTIPDNSNWQLDGKQKQVKEKLMVTILIESVHLNQTLDKGYKLPHLVEVKSL